MSIHKGSAVLVADGNRQLVALVHSKPRDPDRHCLLVTEHYKPAWDYAWSVKPAPDTEETEAKRARIAAWLITPQGIAKLREWRGRDQKPAGPTGGRGIAPNGQVPFTLSRGRLAPAEMGSAFIRYLDRDSREVKGEDGTAASVPVADAIEPTFSELLRYRRSYPTLYRELVEHELGGWEFEGMAEYLAAEEINARIRAARHDAKAVRVCGAETPNEPQAVLLSRENYETLKVGEGAPDNGCLPALCGSRS